MFEQATSRFLMIGAVFLATGCDGGGVPGDAGRSGDVPTAGQSSPSTQATAAAMSDCERAFSEAASVPATQDTHEDLFPAYRACESLEDWSAADRRFPAALDGVDPIAYATTVCTQNPSVLGSSRICEAIRAKAVAEAPESSLARADEAAMLGVPLPRGATLEETRSGAGKDTFEVYAVDASESDIRTFFESELPKDGWTEDANLPGFWSKGRYLMTVSVMDGGFTVGGS